jgi:hypothetical protein
MNKQTIVKILLLQAAVLSGEKGYFEIELDR